MKHLSTLSILALLVMALTGCTTGGGGNGAGAMISADPLVSTDLTAVEAALINDRVSASLLAPTTAASILAAPGDVSADVLAAGSFSRGGRRYQGGRQGNRAQASRGTQSCSVAFDMIPAGGSLATATVGSTTCQVLRLDDGSLQVVRADGTSLMMVPVAGSSSTVVISDNGVNWLATYGSTAADPLVTLVNQRSGRTLTVTESDDGVLSVTTSGGGRFMGRWQTDGTVALDDTGEGRQYRCRGGRCS